MKNKIWMIGIVLFLLTGCSKEDVYTLSKDEVSIEVGTKDFNPISYLLKNDEPLSATEQEKIKTGIAVDTSELGNYTLQFPEYGLELKVSVEDTEKPELSLLGFDIMQWEVFTWNEESLSKLKAQVKDNYDAGSLLKKSLQCASVDTSKVGAQEISCQIEDSSGNQTKEIVKINVLPSNEKPENYGNDPVPGKVEKPVPVS